MARSMSLREGYQDGTRTVSDSSNWYQFLSKQDFIGTDYYKVLCLGRISDVQLPTKLFMKFRDRDSGDIIKDVEFSPVQLDENTFKDICSQDALQINPENSQFYCGDLIIRELPK